MNHNDRIEDDADLAALLRAVGPRAAPDAAMAAEVRAAVAAEWRAVVAERRQPAAAATVTTLPRRNVAAPRWLALAASVAAVAVAVAVALPRWQAAQAPVATVARLDGPVEVRHADADQWQALAAGAEVRRDDAIRTGAGGRVALQRADGLEVRLDSATQLAFDDSTRAQFDGGSVYVDAGAPGTKRADFVLDTPYGDVRHLGTQYLATLEPTGLRVAVREGSVALESGAVPATARAGEVLAIDRAGHVTRASIAAHGAAWTAAEAIAPAYAIDGKTLDAFLAWTARETGRTVVYTSPEAARVAEQTVLKGSVAGLEPTAALDAVFAAEPTLQHRIAAGQIRVEQAPR